MHRSHLPFALLISGGLCAIILLWRTEALQQNVLMIDALACTCPDYRVVQGSWKLSSPLLDTIAHLDKGEVYITGVKNPFNDPMTLYDFLLVEGEVIGIDRVSEGAPWNPVIRVARWEHMGVWMEFGYGILKWGAILFSSLGIWMLFARHSGY